MVTRVDVGHSIWWTDTLSPGRNEQPVAIVVAILLHMMSSVQWTSSPFDMASAHPPPGAGTDVQTTPSVVDVFLHSVLALDERAKSNNLLHHPETGNVQLPSSELCLLSWLLFVRAIVLV
jgi:hypothetical protein